MLISVCARTYMTPESTKRKPELDLFHEKPLEINFFRCFFHARSEKQPQKVPNLLHRCIDIQKANTYIQEILDFP